MVLKKGIIKQINDLVYQKPRTIQEIAQALEKNWRTANAYVERIAQEEGTLSVRTFRGGTRGALKIAYWNNLDKPHTTRFQERLFNQIILGKKKTDFSPFDIYQHLEEGKRRIYLEEKENSPRIKNNIINLFHQAEEQILCFSGNLSWINLATSKTKIINLLKETARKGISIKILTRVELPGLKNLLQAERINELIGRQVLEIRHTPHPLRGFIIDNKIAWLKETKKPQDYKAGEIEKETFLFYSIYDREWIEFLKKTFWHLFRTALPARKRLKDLEKLEKL